MRRFGQGTSDHKHLSIITTRQPSSPTVLRQCCRLESLEARLLWDALPLGPEFRVNTLTSNHQSDPAVAATPAGDFIVAWRHLGATEDIRAQRYDSSGTPLGGEFLVNTYTTNAQTAPSIAVAANGDFVIVWESANQVALGRDIFGQRFNASGAPTGSEFRINTYTTGDQFDPAVAANAGGDFVVVWRSQQQDDPTDETGGVYGQRYSGAGVAQGGEFLVNTYTTGSQETPAIAVDSQGDFVVTWLSRGQEGNEYGIYARRYGASGTPAGTEFRVNASTAGETTNPVVVYGTEGHFVIAFQDRDEILGNDVFVRRFDALGVAQGTEFRVNTYTTNNQGAPSIAIDATGDFVVAWNSTGQDGNSVGVYAQRLTASGAMSGSEFRVNSYTTGIQRDSTIAMAGNGNFVVVWESVNQDGSASGVYAQRYAVTPTIVSGVFEFETAPQRLMFTFDRNVSSSLSLEDVVFEKVGGGTVPVLTLLPFGTEGTNVATFTVDSPLADGNYRATLLAAGINDPNDGDPMAANYVMDFFILGGDANHDRKVDLSDLVILANNWMGTEKTFSQGDFDYNGIVDAADLGILATRWQQTLAPPAPVLAEARPTSATRRTPVRSATRLVGLVE